MSGQPANADFFAGVHTLAQLLERRAQWTPAGIAYHVRDGAAWSAVTWSEFHARASRLAGALAAHGVGLGTRFGILAGTSLGWQTAQMAALACGATVVGIDPYYPDALIDELVGSVTHLVVHDAAMLSRVSPRVRAGLAFVAVVDDAPPPSGCLSLTALRDGSGAHPPPPVALAAGAPAVVAFSSGSTGRPRPIVYTHAQVVYACRCIVELYPEVSASGKLVCWLPLANLFQRMIDFAAMAKGAASYVVEDPRQAIDVLPIANPEVFVAVPRFCERLYAGVMQRIESRPLRARVMKRAIALGRALRDAEAGRARLSARRRAAARLADRFLLSRVRGVMGRNLRFIVTGSAPMPRWLLDAFEAFGIPILEAYGASENLVPIAANRLRERKPGTVGRPVGDNEVRVSDAGEVQVRGSGVFDPAVAENAALAGMLTPDGFLATGDMGTLDAQGFLTLHGRMTETFKTAQGRWIALPHIEALLRKVPGVEHAAVVPLDNGALGAVLSMGAAPPAREARAHTRRARAVPPEAALGGHLARELVMLPAAMRPTVFVAVRAAFSPAGGELTTNLKLRRAAIADKFAPLLRDALDERAAASPAPDEPLVKVL